MQTDHRALYPWKKGTSLSFFDDLKRTEVPVFGQEGFGQEEKKILTQVKDSGFDCVELSFSYDDYMRRYNLPKTTTALKDFCDQIGLRIWSLHLPFGDYWDISARTCHDVVQEFTLLLQAAHQAGCSVAVVHPSFEPIADEFRSARFSRCKNSIHALADIAGNLDIVLGVENLPRTCLGNTSEEMYQLLDGTGASWLFDTNHSLHEDNVAFLQNMLHHHYVPCSLHISDYDFVDERHDLPGTGVNPWKTLLSLLQENGYTGPAMYEIRHQVNPNRILTFQDVSRNIQDLLSGNIE